MEQEDDTTYISGVVLDQSRVKHPAAVLRRVFHGMPSPAFPAKMSKVSAVSLPCPDVYWLVKRSRGAAVSVVAVVVGGGGG